MTSRFFTIVALCGLTLAHPATAFDANIFPPITWPKEGAFDNKRMKKAAVRVTKNARVYGEKKSIIKSKEIAPKDKR